MYVTVDEWTYENMSELTEGSALLDVPYEQFAHTISQTEVLTETLRVSGSILSQVMSIIRTESLNFFDTASGTSIGSFWDPMFVTPTMGNRSASVEVVENLSLSEDFSCVLDTAKHQYVSFYDTKAKANNGETTEETNAEREPITLVSDLEFSYAPQGDSEFKEYCNRKSPVGYSVLRPLYAGDYEYKDAVVGVQVTLTPPIEGRYGISGSTLHIDVEDVVDKGTVYCDGTSATVVGFNKSFFTRPKIFTSISNASASCKTVITEVDTRSTNETSEKGYFKIELRSVTDGTLCSGTVDWLAEGY